MSNAAPPSPPASSAPLLPVADDQHIAAELDVALSTPLTLVVNAQLEVAGAEQSSVDLALVIPRSQCRGERPHLTALLEAAQAAVARATRGGTRHQPRRVLTRVAGQPHLIPLFEPA
ncbi:hypothetical protein [Roseateles sp.]|uniref:hypothetical protein n=1 Tax=Roseateles sp. TaxID=1971397 RepID=UPI0039EB61A3